MRWLGFATECSWSPTPGGPDLCVAQVLLFMGTNNLLPLECFFTIWVFNMLLMYFVFHSVMFLILGSAKRIQ